MAPMVTMVMGIVINNVGVAPVVGVASSKYELISLSSFSGIEPKYLSGRKTDTVGSHRLERFLFTLEVGVVYTGGCGQWVWLTCLYTWGTYCYTTCLLLLIVTKRREILAVIRLLNIMTLTLVLLFDSGRGLSLRSSALISGR